LSDRRDEDDGGEVIGRKPIVAGTSSLAITRRSVTSVDLERGFLKLTDSKIRAKTVYLNAAAKTLLATLPRLEGNPYVVPASAGKTSRQHRNALAQDPPAR
jgi:hypothetical protein